MFIHFHRVSVSSSEKIRFFSGETMSVCFSSGSDGSAAGGDCTEKINEFEPNTAPTELETDLTNASAIKEEPSPDGRTVLNTSVFARSYHSEPPERFIVRSGVNTAVAVLGLVAIGLTIAGSILPAVSYEASGVFAEAIQSSQDTDVYRTEYGVISLAQKVVSDASVLGEGKYIFGLWLIAFLLVLTVMVTPIACVCGLLVQWFYPLQKLTRRKIVAANDRIHAWQFLETFVIAAVAVAVVFQLEFSQLLIGRYCEGLGALISAAVDVGLLEGPDLDCYVVSGSVEVGSLLLLLAAFCIALLHLFVTTAAQQAEHTESKELLSSVKRLVPTSSLTEEDKLAKIEQIDSPSAVFTDRFRFCVLCVNWQ